MKLQTVILAVTLSTAAFAAKLSDDDVVRMVHRKMTVAQIVDRINQSETNFRLYPEDAQRLRRQGVPEIVLDAMYARQTGDKLDISKANPATSPAGAQTAAVVSPKAAAPMPGGMTQPAVDVFAGYSFLSVDPNSTYVSRQNANGWASSVTVYANRWLGAEGNFSGYYKTYSISQLIPHGTGSVDAHDYGLLGGPHLAFRYGFAHVLFGSDNLVGSAFGLSASQTSFAVAMGGGIQAPISGHWSLCPTFDYVLTHHNIYGGPRVQQNNFRVAAGVAYSFGLLR